MATLYVIPTPIGNVGDITKRALDILNSINIVLCEDTRVTSRLLKLLAIDSQNKKLLPYFEHNEREKIHSVIDFLKSGNDVAIVSDAGTPLLSDPGFPLVREIRHLQKEGEKEIKVEVLPGATSITTALIATGLPTDKFTFLGFAPRKPNDRKKLLSGVRKSDQQLSSTYVLFETAQRLQATLMAIKQVLGNRVQISLCRELTKMHESIDSGNVDEIIDLVQSAKYDSRGELVVVFNLNESKTLGKNQKSLRRIHKKSR